MNTIQYIPQYHFNEHNQQQDEKEKQMKRIKQRIKEQWKTSSPTPDTFLNNETQTKSYVDYLCQWSHFSSCEIIFDTDDQELTTKNVWRTLRGRKNIAMIITDVHGWVFGSFNGIIPKKQSNIVSNDYDHFLFSFKNPFDVPPTRFRQNFRNENQLIIHRDNQNSWVFGIGYGFHIRDDGKSYIGSASGEQLNRGYIDTIGLNSLIFNETSYPTYFSFERIIFLQFN